VSEPLDIDTILASRPLLPPAPPAIFAPPPRAAEPSESPELARISMATRKKRASAYLVQAEPSVSGEHGHNVAMRVVGAVVRGFALGNTAEACLVLDAWNARCEPPWSPFELGHKVDDAMRVGALPWGKMLLEPPKAAPPEPARVEHVETHQLAPELPFDEIWTPEPELSLVIPALGICPGPAHLVAGSWYTGKTLFLMALGLAVASGVDLFGLYGVKHGVWKHFDHEMGRRAIKRYLQRMVAGLGIPPEELRGHMGVHVMPSLNLTTANATDHYCRLLEGAQLATIDPLRAAAPGQDENDSSFRQWVDIANVVSDRTGCAIVLLHHGGKPTLGAARRNTGRGTSAIDDAVQSKFVLTAESKGEPIQVSHEKTRELSQTLDDFWIRIENYENAVRLAHLDPQQMTGIDEAKRALDERSRIDRARAAIVATLEQYAGNVAGTRSDFLGLVKGDRNYTSRAFTEMCAEGVIRRQKGAIRYGV